MEIVHKDKDREIFQRILIEKNLKTNLGGLLSVPIMTEKELFRIIKLYTKEREQILK